uniref:Bro-N domain-containing protein n=1 Tax=Desulfobacca acetoxidans TaxID=60893 RepID=A0A7C3SK07_9BACT
METSVALHAEIVEFEGVRLAVLEQGEERWFTAEDIGKALGLSQPRKEIINLFNRNRDEFDGLHRVINLMTWLKSGLKIPRRFTVFNPQGAYLLAILARTPKSKALRRWLSRFLAHDLHRLREGVEQMKEANRKLQESLDWHQGKVTQLEGRVRQLTRQDERLRELMNLRQKDLARIAGLEKRLQKAQRDLSGTQKSITSPPPPEWLAGLEEFLEGCFINACRQYFGFRR